MQDEALNTKLHQQKIIKSAIFLSVITATTVLIVKTYGWVVTGSASLFAALIDSLLDISSSLINMIAIRIALLPPDDNHRFGHNKVQDLAIFSQSILFLGSAVFTLFSAINKLFSSDQVVNHNIGVGVMMISTISVFILICYQNYAYKKTKSDIVAADRLHNITDLLTNVAVIISLKVSTSWWFIDSLFAMLIGMYLLYGSTKLFQKALKHLMDQEFDKDEKQKILDIIRSHKEILGVHELKTRYAGNKPFVQCHLEMDGNMTLARSHEISDRIKQQIEKLFPDVEIIIHQDPAGHEDNVMYQEKI